ncbi:hypothetical protein TCAL_06855 [Tigriopus californicus]|uniref:Major facilitator superfamily (MFS) profile domain-containing protein n=1 Tax=Tigriopus californicus TaxID=6832 RepID=A0A553NDH4_TIGCA|nr:monocarboxylate transporter 9-like [Tigriopus californicus]TRY63483.1 hypothetical protein TCAL_06855 [Tigriopus californicus]|eukprot:TCALIF_06855-PA protein Name:"Similar to Slc16a14 Monocarboxylate transporter 14 (Mus musculus)" AED:0.04 eAED:0.04 QI:0/-1/0/1/-1/1/1/0/780
MSELSPKKSSEDLETRHPPPTFAVHSPDGEEERPLFGEDIVVPLVDIPPPPDGGWGWVICFASFMCNLILDGIAYTFGIMLEPLVEHYGSNRSTVSWVGSLLTGVYLMSGPIVGGLVNKYGCRPVCITGSIVSCAGLLLSTISPNVPVLMLTYGVIGGFGLGLIYLPAVVAVGYYFEKKRALATGISVCGSGVGTFLFAPLATYLIAQLGWKGANMIFAGFCLSCSLFGALMRPLELELVDNSDLEDGGGDDNFTVHLPDGTHHFQNGSEQTSGSLTPNQSFHLSHDIGFLSPSINLNQLPTIEEQNIITTTIEENDGEEKEPNDEDEEEEEDEEEMEVQPEADVNQLREQAQLDARNARAALKRRTISEHMPPSQGSHTKLGIRSPKSSSRIPRNSSAPHFVDTSMMMPRNSSSPGFGRLTRMLSQISQDGNNSTLDDHIAFCIDGAQLDSNKTLLLRPASQSSRRGSRPIVRPLYRKDVFYSGSVANLVHDEDHQSRRMSHVPSFANLDEYRHSVISIPKTPRRQSMLSMHRGSIVASHLSIPQHIRKASLAEDDPDLNEPGLSTLREMLNLELLGNKMFLLIGISNVFGMLGFYTPFVYLPNMANLRGVEIDDANFLISIIGISNTLGRVFSGWMSDFSWVNPFVVTNVAVLCSGISVFVLPLCQGYISYTAIALLFGLFTAAYVSLTSIVLVQTLGLDKLTSAFGLLVLFRGVASVVGPPIAGSIFDATQSYDISFYMGGVFLAIAAIVSTAADILNRRSLKLNHPKANGALTKPT